MSVSFDDLDLYQAAVKHWGLEFVQLDRGPLRAVVNLVQSDRLQIVNTSLNRTFHQQGLAPKLGATFAVLAHRRSTVTWLGGLMEPDTIAIFPADGAFEAYSGHGFDVHVVTLDRTLLERAAELYEMQNVLDELPRCGEIRTCNRDDMAALRRGLEHRLRCSGKPQAVFRPNDVDIARLVLRTLARYTGLTKLPSQRRRDRAFRTGVEVIREHFDKGLTIPDVATAASVSERTLRYAFEERLGVSPKSYLNLVRLNRARSALLDADPAVTSVQDVALDLGFGQLGEFSRLFRRMYGELPSQMIRQGR